MSFSDSEAFWLTIEDIQQRGGAEYVDSETKTEELEQKLNSILHNGSQIGAGKKKSSKKGSKVSTGGKRKKSSKKGSKGGSWKMKKSSKKGSKDIEGGKKKANLKEKTVKKSSKKGSKVSTGGKKKKGSKQSRSLPEALLLFQELVKHVAAGIGKAGRPAMTIAGQVKKDLLAKDSSLAGKEMINAAKKHFDDNKDKYMKMM